MEDSKKDFETYLISSLNDSLIRKSIALFINIDRWDKEFEVWQLVVGKQREEYDHSLLSLGWQPTWDHHQGHQVLCKGNICNRET